MPKGGKRSVKRDQPNIGKEASGSGQQFLQSIHIIRHHLERRVDGVGGGQVHACAFEDFERIVGCARFEEAEIIFDRVGFVVEDALGESVCARYPGRVGVDVIIGEEVAEA